MVPTLIFSFPPCSPANFRFSLRFTPDKGKVAKKLAGVLTYTPATESIADYTSNQHTTIYHREVE